MRNIDRNLADALGHLDHDVILAQLLDAGLIGALLVSLEGQVVFANEACCRMFGLEGDDLVARGIDELVHPEDREASRRDVSVVTTSGAGKLDFERRYIRRDGRAAWAKGSVSLLCDKETSEPFMLAYLLSDTTRAKETAIEKERMQLTLQSMGDAVLCTDVHSLVTFLNPVAERLTGWSMADATGRPAAEVFSLIDERSGRPPASPIEQCMQQRGTLMCETGMILLSRTGDAFDIGLSAAPVRSGETILGAVVVFNDLTKINADRRKVARSALHDGLTGLPNRGAFIEKLAVALTEARDEGRTHALCFIDLDRFKLVNDRAGHAAGDALLSHVAKIIALSCSSKDVPARLGGDEFAVLIRDCTANDAEKTASQIVHAIGDIEFRWETQLFRIGASIGATMITDASTCLEDMLNEADQACYRAKHSGRGQVFIHNPTHKTIGRGSDPHPSKWLNIH